MTRTWGELVEEFEAIEATPPVLPDVNHERVLAIRSVLWNNEDLLTPVQLNRKKLENLEGLFGHSRVACEIFNYFYLSAWTCNRVFITPFGWHYFLSYEDNPDVILDITADSYSDEMVIPYAKGTQIILPDKLSGKALKILSEIKRCYNQIHKEKYGDIVYADQSKIYLQGSATSTSNLITWSNSTVTGYTAGTGFTV